MTTTLTFDFPITFPATPVRHKTPKFVCGKFTQTFEVAEVEPSEISALMDLEISSSKTKYFEIEGGFFRLVGKLDGDEVGTRYSAGNSQIPVVKKEFSHMLNTARKNAKRAGLPLFPKDTPGTGIINTLLKREWFSERDLEWIDGQIQGATEYLSSLRCSEGMLYEPLAEPAFVVNMDTDGNKPSSLSVRFQSHDERPLYWGCPIAYFRADQQDEAMEYATSLAMKHGVKVDVADRREIVMHDPDSLTFDPFPSHAFEACYLAYKALLSLPIKDEDRDEEIVRLISEMIDILGSDGDDWRSEPSTENLQAKAVQAEILTREALESSANMHKFPLLIIEALLERWDERPINVPTKEQGHLFM